MAPASWPWQANWVVGDGQDISKDNEGEADELDLFEAGELEGDEPLLAELAGELGCGRQDARAALRSTAMALTRASLLAAAGGEEEADDEGEDEEEDVDDGA